LTAAPPGLNAWPYGFLQKNGIIPFWPVSEPSRELQTMSAPTSYPHIEKRPDGKLWLIGTQTKVLEVALDRLAHHWDADEIQRQHPHLTLGQIHSCLAYYYDHQEEMDRTIDEQMHAIERLRRVPCFRGLSEACPMAQDR
jgi:uncharacterized protein (DUF433 family)